MKKLYLKVTDDEYELPVAVADTMPELAEMVGVNHKTVYRGVKRYKQGSASAFIRVEIEDE